MRDLAAIAPLQRPVVPHIRRRRHFCTINSDRCDRPLGGENPSCWPGTKRVTCVEENTAADRIEPNASVRLFSRSIDASGCSIPRPPRRAARRASTALLDHSRGAAPRKRRDECHRCVWTRTNRSRGAANIPSSPRKLPHTQTRTVSPTVSSGPGTECALGFDGAEKLDQALQPVQHRRFIHADAIVIQGTGGASVGHHGDEAVEKERRPARIRSAA
jgi:hypothetical protein